MSKVLVRIGIHVGLVVSVVLANLLLPVGLAAAASSASAEAHPVQPRTGWSAPVWLPAQSPTGDPEVPVTIHIVQPGETLFRISVHYGVPMALVAAANNLVNPSRIFVGQQLVIPAPDWNPASSPPSTTPVRHIVQRGEILSRIASQYGVSMWAIAQANNISNPSMLYAGQVLVIPTTAAPPSADQTVPTTTYDVQRGDTLYKIAVRHGVSVSDLVAWNSIPNINRIEVGDRLTIPLVPGSVPPGGVAQPPSEDAPPLSQAATPAAPTSEGKLILVVLAEQRAYAYQDGALLGEFVVSTGLPGTPTVTGDYAIYVKYRYARMIGPGYDLPNVPYVMYFYSGYGLHGTYWHDNFGHPMSHGCVNLRTSDAEWLYNWAPVGTPVRVVYSR